MSQQEFIQAIRESLNNSEEIQKRGEEKILAFIQDPNTISLCLELLMTNFDHGIQMYSSVYAHKIIKLNWKMMDFDVRNEIRDMVMKVLVSVNLSEDVLNNFLDSVKYIYSHDETHWPDLIGFIQSNQSLPISLFVSKKIIPKMPEGDFQELKDFFLQLSLSAITCDELNIQLLGVSIYQLVVLSLKEDPESEPHIQALYQILLNCLEFDIFNMKTVWSCVNDISIYDCIPEIIYTEIAQIALHIAQNQEIDPQIRSVPIEALLPKIESIPEEMLIQILSASVDITATTILQDGCLYDDLELFNTAACMINHDDLYPLIQAQIQEALESESIAHQISGLLVTKVLLERFPDQAYNDIENIIGLLTVALSSEEELVKEAGLQVVETFVDSFKSTNVYTPKFLELVFPNLLSESPDTRMHAFKALYNIFSHMDTKVSGFLNQYLEMSEQIEQDNMVEYLTVIALLVDCADDFTDEDCDQIITIINSMIEMNDKQNIAICFEIAIALLHQDESQIDYVVETLFPFVEDFLQNPNADIELDNCNIIDETFDFIGNLSLHLREESYQYFEPFVPAIIQFLDNDLIKNEVKAGMIINTAKLAKFSGENAVEIVSHLIPNIVEGLQSDEDYYQTQSVSAIRKIKKFLSPQYSADIFSILIGNLEEAAGYDTFIEEELLTAAKLLIIADESNVEVFLNQSIEFVQTIFDNSWNLLNEKPLIESPHSSDILPPLCHFFSAIFHYQTIINDTICEFLIQWIEKNNEIDLFEIVGSLTDCLEYKNVSEEMRQTILNSVTKIMEDANEPSLIQNLVYLMNLLVQDEKASALLQSIVDLTPTFEKWRQIADDSKYGYQEVLANIASLYLQISLRCPEFPDNLVSFSIEQFPPHDINETASMTEAIINLVGSKQDPNMYEQAALAFTRFFVQEDSKIDKAKISDEIKIHMIRFLKEIFSQNEQVFGKIRASYGRQRSKIRKIEALLNSDI